MKEAKRSTFSGRIGFVLAAAGSAVGLGNLWRFPYLAAKYGGGIFLLIYILLAVTFGFTLMITEIAIGRKTHRSPMEAYGILNKKWKWLGVLSTLVPVIILPYYCVIGGWVIKYAAVMITGGVQEAAANGYFTSFTERPFEPLIWFFIYTTATAVIVFLGVDKGIEKMSRYLMPALLVITVALTIFVICQPGALEGVIYYLKPDFSKLSIMTFVAALGQLFFSMSLAMGIMVTYGSYLKKDSNIVTSTRQIEAFDTVVALLAGLMIVPSVFVYSGGNETALGQGPGLMFDTLPKVFAGMPFGSAVGAAFFVLVLFAALTSSVSVMEAIVAGMTDKYKIDRKKASLIVYAYALLIGTFCAFGFSIWKSFTIMDLSILDFLDFISNSVMMPLVGMLTCVLVGFIIKPKAITDEVELNGRFKEKKFYNIMVKWIAPVCIFAILISSVLNTLGIVTI
ncbi:MAG TPA: sodium-dependent transporter [Candidatus Eubacterium faecipullorum]|uniref:Transporter n=1 Tax=Candidatus Eubacterium faecipullorum TaxID=2838571 RepID=A0A9D1UF27_9FIRM|nr:sodium-dependent transporter [Candidatus Eubacterium faecipullorum]